MAQRDSEVAPLAEVSVCDSLDQVFIVANPAIACSTIWVILSFTTLPHEPLSSPCVGRASFRIEVYCVAIYLTSSYPYDSGIVVCCRKRHGERTTQSCFVCSKI